MSIDITDPACVRVQVGIDAAVVANHHVCVRETTADGQVRRHCCIKAWSDQEAGNLPVAA